MGRHNNREQVYIVRFGVHNFHDTPKKANVIAMSHKQAERMAKDYPDVKSVAKAQKVYDRIENRALVDFTTKLMQDIAQPKMTPLAMDEFLWMRRTKRIENRDKDKKDT
jgi:hypothetical protein